MMASSMEIECASPISDVSGGWQARRGRGSVDDFWVRWKMVMKNESINQFRHKCPHNPIDQQFQLTPINVKNVFWKLISVKLNIVSNNSSI